MNPTTRPYQQGRTGGETDRATQLRRDNDIVTVPKVTLYDIDFAIYFHLTENLKLSVISNGNNIPVPAMFANGEKWSQIRQHGYLRDHSKKVLAPLIIIRRTGVTADERLPIVDLNNFNPQYKVLPYKTTNMQYDRIAGQYAAKDSYEFYVVDVPDFIRLNYELLIWTDLQEQMNYLTHTIIGVSDHMWGDYHTFRTNVQDITHDNVNVPGEDRLVKTTITLQVDGYLRAEYEYSQAKIQKAYSVKRVRFMESDSPPILTDQFAGIDTTPNNIADINDLTDHFNLRKKIRI
jgi:hypothetical protein